MPPCPWQEPVEKGRESFRVWHLSWTSCESEELPTRFMGSWWALSNVQTHLAPRIPFPDVELQSCPGSSSPCIVAVQGRQVERRPALLALHGPALAPAGFDLRITAGWASLASNTCRLLISTHNVH